MTISSSVIKLPFNHYPKVVGMAGPCEISMLRAWSSLTLYTALLTLLLAGCVYWILRVQVLRSDALWRNRPAFVLQCCTLCALQQWDKSTGKHFCLFTETIVVSEENLEHYFMDKTGYPLHPKPPKVLCKKDQKKVGNHSLGNKSQITVIGCVIASAISTSFAPSTSSAPFMSSAPSTSSALSTLSASSKSSAPATSLSALFTSDISRTSVEQTECAFSFGLYTDDGHETVWRTCTWMSMVIKYLAPPVWICSYMHC